MILYNRHSYSHYIHSDYIDGSRVGAGLGYFAEESQGGHQSTDEAELLGD